jgi:hypothetical protein
MPLRRTLLTLFLCAAVVRADEGTGLKVEMRTLKGEVVRGELLSVSVAEVVVAKADGKQTVPTAQVLSVDVEQAEKPTPPASYLDVEIVDGSVFHCAACEIKGKQVKLTLVSGQEVPLPLVKVSNLIRDAQDPAKRKRWNQELGRKKTSDVLATLNKGTISALDVKIVFFSDDGKNLNVNIEDIGARTIPVEKVEGLIFERAADPNMPLAICKLVDVFGTVVMVQEIAIKNGEAKVTTPGGVALSVPLKLIQRFDYNRDKLKYLSELDPIKQEVKASEDFQTGPGLDVNLNGGPIRLGETTYPRGLSLRANTELVYDLRGDFREFKAVAGVDKSLLEKGVKGVKATAKLVIECDGRERYSKTFTPEDKEAATPFTINVKDVQKLRILVTRDDSWAVNYSCHLTLADAKVMK